MQKILGVYGSLLSVLLALRFSLVDLKNMAAANDGSLEFASSGGNSSSSSSNSNTSNSNSSSSGVATASSNANPVTMPPGYVTAPPAQQQQQHPHSHQQHQMAAMDPRYGCGAPAPLLPPPLPMPALGPPPRSLEQMIIYENFDVHETHRIEDGVCTHISRLPPKKQELLKQFGIQSSSQQCLSNYEKYILIENFIKFCNVSKSVSKEQRKRSGGGSQPTVDQRSFVLWPTPPSNWRSKETDIGIHSKLHPHQLVQSIEQNSCPSFKTRAILIYFQLFYSLFLFLIT